jgi:carbon monoxide dehydrogenase subunit G
MRFFPLVFRPRFPDNVRLSHDDPLEDFMKKIAALVSIALFAWGGAAHAHGGTRQKVVESIEINASPEAVWNIIKDFGDAKWMPMVASSSAHTGDKGTIRELTLKKGGVIKEELKEADATSHTLKYRIHEEPDCAVFATNNYSATISVTASGSGSKVDWTSAAYRCFTPNNPPPGQDEKAAIEAMTNVSKESLANLKALAEKK